LNELELELRGSEPCYRVVCRTIVDDNHSKLVSFDSTELFQDRQRIAGTVPVHDDDGYRS
jgi:hypothetical protein